MPTQEAAPTEIPIDLTATITKTHKPSQTASPIPNETNYATAPVVCAPPADWVSYIVEKGDTLFSLGQAYGISASLLQALNCLPSSEIQTGQTIQVPNIITNTPVATSNGDEPVSP